MRSGSGNSNGSMTIDRPRAASAMGGSRPMTGHMGEPVHTCHCYFCNDDQGRTFFSFILPQGTGNLGTEFGPLGSTAFGSRHGPTALRVIHIKMIGRNLEKCYYADIPVPIPLEYSLPIQQMAYQHRSPAAVPAPAFIPGSVPEI